MNVPHEPTPHPTKPDRPRFRHVGRSVKLAGALMAVGLVAAACGSSASKSSTASGTSAPASSSSSASAPATTAGPAVQSSQSSVTVDEHTISGLGSVLTDSAGRTLYMFAPDKQKSVTCTSAACVKAWPPLTASGSPKAGSGVKSSLLGTIKDGSSTVVTYNHWPLYTFVDDTKAGEAKGQGVSGFGGPWYAISPAGSVVKTSTKSSAPSGSTGGATAY
jgi:predicted lipoprotein with Yx(FWY)xxD motif